MRPFGNSFRGVDVRRNLHKKPIAIGLIVLCKGLDIATAMSERRVACESYTQVLNVSVSLGLDLEQSEETDSISPMHAVCGAECRQLSGG